MSAEVFGHSLVPSVIADENERFFSVLNCADAKEHEDILRSNGLIPNKC
jgi:hypothetical protein